MDHKNDLVGSDAQVTLSHVTYRDTCVLLRKDHKSSTSGQVG